MLRTRAVEVSLWEAMPPEEELRLPEELARVDRARDDLERLGRGLGSRHYPDAAAVTARVATIARERRVSSYLRSDVGTDPETQPLVCDVGRSPDRYYARRP